MVLGGNIIVGKYSSSFFKNSSENRIKEVLCGVIPWLSSTQGKCFKVTSNTEALFM
jgi:hypothetical protein